MSSHNSNRKIILAFAFIATGVIFMLRLFYIQIFDDKWLKEAEAIVEAREFVSPSRGLMFDRHYTLMAENRNAYNVKVVLADFFKHQKSFDTLAFCQLLAISKEEFQSKMTKALGAEEAYVIQTSLQKQLYETHKTELNEIKGLNFKDNGGSLIVTVRAARFDYQDTTNLASMLGMKKELLVKKLKTAWRQPILMFAKRPFVQLIPAETFTKIGEQLYKYPGFVAEPVLYRYYPIQAAAQALGYVNETGKEILESDRYYRVGDFVGATGLELEYEKNLRGKRGQLFYLRNAYSGKVKQSMQNKDSLAESGEDLYTTLHSELQQYGEALMQGKVGSIVAIEPQTGEILAMISAATYNPNALTGRDFSKNYQNLVLNDSLTPLYNKAVRATYRPGSIFKLVQSLVGLQEQAITANTGFPCNQKLVGCHNHPPAQNLRQAIQNSCNPYYYSVFKRMIQKGAQPSIFRDAAIGLDTWYNHVSSFGFGSTFQTDINGLYKGILPNKHFYDRVYGEYRWAFSTIYSLSIGEGELLVTPLQMANLAATIANRGYYYTPHLVRRTSLHSKNPLFTKKSYTTVDAEHFTPVIDGMEDVVKSGTGRAAQVREITVCGKTGTAQNHKKNHDKKIQMFRDHSVFIGFAPKENPKIAIAVYVEYAGFGGTYAAPIAGLMIEKYLHGEVLDKKKEEYYKNAVIEKNQPIYWVSPKPQ